MTYRHSEDIDPNRELDTQEMDRRIRSIAERLAIAFDRSAT
jgi:hypothetical protein